MLRALAIVVTLPLNLMLWGTLVLLGGLFKLLTTGETRRRIILRLASLGDCWVEGNNRIFDTFLTTRWVIEGIDDLDRDGHYLIISNHVSWVDIFALFRAFHGKAPFIRFFMKRILLWFPIMGQACWGLEFPFMRRYSREYLARHPEKRGLDLETTRVACQRYKTIPVSIANFVEGTRFTHEKHEDQQSPYAHLLRPRPGGVSFVIASLGDHLDAIFDVTIVYPEHDVTLWRFVSNQLPWIRIHGRRLAIPAEFKTAAATEPGPARERFKQWLEAIWREKDARIEAIRATSA